MSENFRTCVFGGFDKDDVVKFIEKLAQEHKAEITRLTEEKDSLLEKLNANEVELSDANETVEKLRLTCEQYQSDAADAVNLRDKLEEVMLELEALRIENETLHAENDSLRDSADVYESIKDHIAQIEINAHRRTEEFRAEIITKLKRNIAQQRVWCGRQQERYEQLSNDLLQQIRSAESELKQRDLTCFARMNEELNALEKNLND